MDKKKIGIIAGVAVVVIAVVVGVILFLGRSNEKQLTANLNTLGKQFYEEFYYPSQEKSQDEVKSMVNSKTKAECDKKESTVTIYPEKPYGKSNYKIEVNLECGFKK